MDHYKLANVVEPLSRGGRLRLKLGVGNYGLFFFYLAQVVRNDLFLKDVHHGLFSIPPSRCLW